MECLLPGLRAVACGLSCWYLPVSFWSSSWSRCSSLG